MLTQYPFDNAPLFLRPFLVFSQIPIPTKFAAAVSRTRLHSRLAVVNISMLEGKALHRYPEAQRDMKDEHCGALNSLHH